MPLPGAVSSVLRPAVRRLLLPVSASFSPLQLFANGEAGAWYDPSDLSTVWQDAAGTTAAGVDDPVGRIDDKSGNGNNATQSTDSKRPMLRQSGGLYYLESSVDDVLVVPSMTAKSVFVAAKKASTGGVNVSYLVGGDGIGLQFGGTAASYLSAFDGTDDLQGGSDDAQLHVVSAFFTGASGEFFIDGELAETGTLNQITVTRLFERTDNISLRFNGRFYGGVIVNADKSADRTRTEAYLASKSGASL